MKPALAALLLSALLPASALPANEAPTRVASISLCTDLLLLEVAAPSQIASLTWLGRDPLVSPYAEDARRYPANHARAEELIALAPDLVLADELAPPRSLARLRQLGLRVETVPAARDQGGIARALDRLGTLLGQATTARQRLERLASTPTVPASKGQAWFLQSGGHTPGQGSVASDLLRAAGYTDGAVAAGFAAGGFVPLETLLAANPRALVLPATNSGLPAALGARYLQHPALQRAVAHGTLATMTLPENVWTCGTSLFATAAQRLVAQTRD